MKIIIKVVVFLLLTIVYFEMGSVTYAQGQKNNSISTFLQSQAAIIRLGVWDKFGDQKGYTATFVVIAPNGKQSKSQKNVSADEGWVYADFPNEFTGDAPDYSAYVTYNWKCLVGGKVIAKGQFGWGNSHANSGKELSAVEDKPEKPTVKMSIEDHQIVFDLQKCVKSGSSIICDFSLTNKGDDRLFVWVTNESKLFDELGNGYDGNSGKLANESGGSVRKGFVMGVTTQAQMTFNGIDQNSKRITLLRVHFDVGNDIGLDIRFRNVPLTISR